MSSCTFVTGFIKTDKYISEDSFNSAFNYFEKLVNTNINLILYLSKKFEDKIQRFQQYKNLKIIYIELQDLETYKIVNNISNVSLPNVRHMQADTFQFFTLINSKIELVNNAINLNPFNSSHFSWIDFRIFHVLKNEEESVKRIQKISNESLVASFFTAPGPWPELYEMYDAVNWRYCGGFFIGDIESIKNFYNIYINKLFEIVNNSKKMIWEVNMWAILEKKYNAKIEWYWGDHNDSIIKLPDKYFIN